jgi:metal-sulfur cluster biosynthetic enzyme
LSLTVGNAPCAGRVAGERFTEVSISMAVTFTKDDIYDGLKNVYDPEIGINIVDLGLVYDADIEEDGDVLVTMTLTSLGCPLGPVIVQEVNNALKDLPGIGDTDVKLVWSPPWSPDMMTEEAKDELGIW